MTPDAGAPRAVALATALGCWLLVIVLLLALPSLAAVDDGVAPAVTPVGSALWWALAATPTLQCAALLGVRRTPRTSLLVIAGLALALAVPAPGVAYSLSHLPVVVAVFLAAPRRPWPQMRLVLPLTALAVAAGTLLNGLRSGLSTMPVVLGEALVQGLGVVGITALIALALASIRTAREAQRKEVAALSREREAVEREREALGRAREALGRAAASEERAAMARELHDIAAHHLSGIALVAAAADRQIDTNPQAAHDSVRQVRSQTRAVLDDIRRVVGLLRDSGPAQRSVDNLATVPALVRARAETGMPVRLEQHGPAGGRELGEGVGPLAQLVAYRMIQESLSNAAEHAPGAPCLVVIEDSAAAEIVVTVRNEGGASGEGVGRAATAASIERGGGYGLIGMGERAGLIGARLEHGPTADGGWCVQLSIPRDLTGARPHPAAQEGPR